MVAIHETDEPVQQKRTIWQRSKPWERVVMIGVFGGFVLTVSVLTGNGPF
jgi:hypothetical protein